MALSERLIAPSLRKTPEVSNEYGITTPYLFSPSPSAPKRAGGVLNSPTTSFALTGASIGSAFSAAWAGPLGAALGATYGMVQSAKAKNERNDAYRQATKAAFGQGQDVYDAFATAQTDIEKKFQSNLSAQKAKYAASGALLTDQKISQMTGAEAINRDAATAVLGKEKAAYDASQGGKLIENAYRALVGGSTGDPDLDYKLNTIGIGTDLKTGKGVEDYSKTSIYTKEQAVMVQDYGPTKVQKQDGVKGKDMEYYNEYQTYLGMVQPTFDQYKQAQFGTAAEKAQLSTEQTQRIEQANAYWEPYKAEIALKSAQAQQEWGY